MTKRLLVTLLLVLCSGTLAAREQLAIGAAAPGFTLPNVVDGRNVAMKPDAGGLKVVIFTCNHCPYAKAFEPRIIQIAKQYGAKGVTFLAVNPNDDVKFKEETTANMKARAVEKKYPFPYLKDGNSVTARAYGARVTPHVYVVDGKGIVRYRGYVDDSARPEERKTTGLTDALDALLAGRAVKNPATREFGCTIKFKS